MVSYPFSLPVATNTSSSHDHTQHPPHLLFFTSTSSHLLSILGFYSHAKTFQTSPKLSFKPLISFASPVVPTLHLLLARRPRYIFFLTMTAALPVTTVSQISGKILYCDHAEPLHHHHHHHFTTVIAQHHGQSLPHPSFPTTEVRGWEERHSTAKLGHRNFPAVRYEKEGKKFFPKLIGLKIVDRQAVGGCDGGLLATVFMLGQYWFLENR